MTTNAVATIDPAIALNLNDNARLPTTEVTAPATKAPKKARVLEDTSAPAHTPGVRRDGDFLIFTVDVSKKAVSAMTPSSTGKQFNLKPRESKFQFGKEVAHGVPLKFTLNIGCEYDPKLFLKG